VILAPLLARHLRLSCLLLLIRFKETLGSAKQDVYTFHFLLVYLENIDLIPYSFLQAIKEDHDLVNECFPEDFVFELKLH